MWFFVVGYPAATLRSYISQKHMGMCPSANSQERAAPGPRLSLRRAGWFPEGEGCWYFTKSLCRERVENEKAIGLSTPRMSTPRTWFAMVSGSVGVGQGRQRAGIRSSGISPSKERGRRRPSDWVPRKLRGKLLPDHLRRVPSKFPSFRC